MRERQKDVEEGELEAAYRMLVVLALTHVKTVYIDAFHNPPQRTTAYTQKYFPGREGGHG